MNMIIKAMDPKDTFDFKTTPALQTACKQYYTNFSNMWSYDQYKQDLRVSITLLLRMHLAKKRFFKPKKSRQVTKAKERQGCLYRKGYLRKKMDSLFYLLLKFQNGKQNKIHSIKRTIVSLYDFEKITASKPKSNDAIEEGIVFEKVINEKGKLNLYFNQFYR